MVTVVIIIIKAVGADQAYGAVDGLQPWIQTLQHQRQKKLQKATGGERRERGENTKLWEREEGRFMIGNFGIFMHTERGGGKGSCLGL